jgi:integrase
MNLSMRLFRRPPKTRPLPPEEEWIWYAEFDRKIRISLKTADEKMARKSFDRLKKAWLTRNLAILEGRPPTKKLSDFAREFLEWSQETKRPFTFQTDKQALRRAQEYFGPGTSLAAITRHRADLWLAAMGQEVKRVSANTWLRHFKAALSKAVDWKYLKENPCQGVKQLREQYSFPRFLTKEEVHQLLQAEKVIEYRLLWKFLILAGCRRSEALGITVRDIDCKNQRIYLGETKNGKPRQAFINKELGNILWEIMPQIGKLWRWKPDSVSHHFAATAKKAMVKCRLHDLRHTFGSWLAMEGVKIQVIKDLMGHQDIKTTMIYSHLSQEHLGEAAEKIRIGV